ncbi:chaperone for protein-folding within the ER, fungal-domain-containing protein [Rhodotorula diobovata]|uniref:Chaperone for protein-folding within the ER, fungal-domain-containing protein n=1 Tax=Rhodotorula diobovata TaxID=5288 RepID=A0A5C5FX84_9BASI|nr:chaperone for protein-folding within the ER, fungal-domain-containing protein [Rhodotorula diobovata]
MLHFSPLLALFPSLVALIGLSLLARGVHAQAGWAGVGTWTTGTGGPLTGPAFGVPFNNSFAYPNVSGYSFSFTEDGYFEQAQFTWNSNATDPHCIEAVVLWQHGTYEVNSDGSITTDPTPFKGDGRIQIQNACASVSSRLDYYNQPGVYKAWSVSDWRGLTMLRLSQYDGKLMPRLYLVSDQPADYMYPTQWLT